MHFEKIKAEIPERPKHSDFQVAMEAINSLSYCLKRQTEKVPLDFDYLMDDEQLAAIASFEHILCNFTDVLKRLEKNECPAKLSAQSLGYPNPFNDAFKCVGHIGLFIEICLGKLASVYGNLSDEEMSIVCNTLTSEWEYLNILLNELKEVEQMNISGDGVFK